MFTYTYVYIVQKRPSPLLPRPCRAHKVDTSPSFWQYHAEEIGYTTPIISNWVSGNLKFFHSKSKVARFLQDVDNFKILMNLSGTSIGTFFTFWAPKSTDDFGHISLI